MHFSCLFAKNYWDLIQVGSNSRSSGGWEFESDELREPAGFLSGVTASFLPLTPATVS